MIRNQLAVMALIGGMDASLSEMGAPIRAQKETTPTPYSPLLKKPRIGSHKCECGRVISANKRQCWACTEVSR